MKTIDVRSQKGGNRIVFLLLLMSILFIACTNKITDLNTDDQNIVNDSSSSMVVYPETGGTLSLPASAGIGNLMIPPGALDQETKITISNIIEDDPKGVLLSLQPSGLTFKKPVRFTISYQPKEDGSVPIISLIHLSELNDVIDEGHEQHSWTLLENIVLDAPTNSISGEINHFSSIYVSEDQRVAYLILDLPGKYLRPGDGLFVLSGKRTADLKGRWFPGHAGMVRSIDRDLDKLIVLESTLGGGPAANVNGVQKNSFLSFKRSGHVYMGARRPKGTVMSDGERITAIGYGDLQMGKAYRPWGNFFGEVGTGWICTDILETCWAKANHATQGITDFIPMPSEMFESTVPISEITVKVGEELRIPVYPVIVTDNKNGDSQWYQVGVDVSEVVSVSGQPAKAEWKEDLTHPYRARTLIWTPEPKDAGTTDTIYFQVSGSRTISATLQVNNFNITQKLIVHVRGGHKYLSIYPASKGTTGLWYAYGLPTPQGAVISPASQEHLIDLATGTYPVNPVFENQILEKYTEDWYNEVTFPGRWGPQFHIKRLDDPFNPTPPGVRSWLYWFDYEVPIYDGLN